MFSELFPKNNLRIHFILTLSCFLLTLALGASGLILVLEKNYIGLLLILVSAYTLVNGLSALFSPLVNNPVKKQTYFKLFTL